MKFAPSLVVRRYQWLILLLGIMLLATYWLSRPDWLRLPGARTPSLLQRLRVPQPSDPWKIDAIIDGYVVKLALPQDLDKINLLPPLIQSSVRQRIKYRQRNIQILHDTAQELDQVLNSSRRVHVAEHDQTLEHAVMSLPPKLPGINPQLSLAMHEPLLAALPAYTKVDFFLPKDLIPQVALRLQLLGMAQRVTLHGQPEYQVTEGNIRLPHFTTRWVRDLFLATAKQDGRSLLMLPMAFSQINDLSRPDNNYVKKMDDAQHKVVRVPLFFKGGNLQIGVVRGRRILFIGQNELQQNEQAFYNAFFYSPPREEVLELFKQLVGADEVLVLPNSKHLFHLDMMMSVLNPGTVALIEPVDKGALAEDDQRAIAQARQAFTAYGFRVVGVPTLADWVSTFKSPVNIIPFTHRDSGRLSAIVPQFEYREVSAQGTLQSMELKIRQAYADAGVETIFARSNFNQLRGNFHCAVVPTK